MLQRLQTRLKLKSQATMNDSPSFNCFIYSLKHNFYICIYTCKHEIYNNVMLIVSVSLIANQVCLRTAGSQVCFVLKLVFRWDYGAWVMLGSHDNTLCCSRMNLLLVTASGNERQSNKTDERETRSVKAKITLQSIWDQIIQRKHKKKSSGNQDSVQKYANAHSVYDQRWFIGCLLHHYVFNFNALTG